MRINEALCMEMNFGNEHVVAVVGFMLALLFCKQMLECLHSLLQVWQSCAAYAACCDYGQEHILRGGMLAALLTFSVCQPLRQRSHTDTRSQSRSGGRWRTASRARALRSMCSCSSCLLH